MTDDINSTDLPKVYDCIDIHCYDGQVVSLFGRYEAILMPSKRPSTGQFRKEYAMIVLRDGTEVLMGTYNTIEAQRNPTELATYHGRQVRVSGEIHFVMPSKGQSPRKPGIRNIVEIQELKRTKISE